MVFFSRREINRMRTGNMLGVLLALTVLVSVARGFSQRNQIGQFLFIVIGLVALATIALALVQLFSYRGSTKAILFHQDDKMIIATNHLHDGYRLRFFRDLLNDNITAFSDDEREQWSALKKEGFNAVFKIHGVRKPFILPMLFLVFDEVFVSDHTNRWDYFDCRNTSEPTYSRRGIRPFNDDSVLPESKRQPAT
jgi:hypothetical protein